jgi:hypothetical protein
MPVHRKYQIGDPQEFEILQHPKYNSFYTNQILFINQPINIVCLCISIFIFINLNMGGKNKTERTTPFVLLYNSF